MGLVSFAVSGNFTNTWRLNNAETWGNAYDHPITISNRIGSRSISFLAMEVPSGIFNAFYAEYPHLVITRLSVTSLKLSLKRLTVIRRCLYPATGSLFKENSCRSSTPVDMYNQVGVRLAQNPCLWPREIKHAHDSGSLLFGVLPPISRK